MMREAARVLLLDEHLPSRVVTSLVLRARGFECAHVATEQEAFALIATLHPTAVIYECHRRDGASPGLSRRLRAHARLFSERVLVIALSTQNEPPEFRDIEDIDAYLTKPFQMAELERLLKPSAAGFGPRDPR